MELSEFKTIEELYAIIQNDAAGADLIVSSFDPSFTYPTVVDVDYIAAAVDDEITYRASEFKLLPPNVPSMTRSGNTED